MSRVRVAIVAATCIAVGTSAAAVVTEPADAGTNFGRIVVTAKSRTGLTAYDGYTDYLGRNRGVGKSVYVGPNPVSQRSSYPRIFDTDAGCTPIGTVADVKLYNVFAPDELVGVTVWRSGCHKVSGDRIAEVTVR